jgi:PAS domain S-box-containing protein
MNPRILIVDDHGAIHEDFRRILLPPASSQAERRVAELLRDHLPGVVAPALRPEPSWTIDSAYQGEEALGLATRAHAGGHPYALAFVDIRMPPGWDGLTTIEALWRVDPDLRVVICTAFSDHSWDDICARLDSRDRLLFLRKPFDAIEVLQLATTLTRSWSLERVNRVQQQQLRTIIDRLPAALWVVDGTGTYRLANAAFEAFTGRASAAVVGSSDETAQVEAHRIGAGPEAAHEGRDARFGTDRRVEIAYFPLDGVDGPLVCGLARDITLQRRMEAQMQHFQRMECISRLTSGVAHDFNNILTIIRGFSETLLLDVPSGSPFHEPLQCIFQAAVTGGDLTRQLLGFSRRQGSEAEPFEVDRHLASHLALVARLCGPTVSVSFDPGAPGAIVRMDPTALSQVVFNLAANARDAMEDGGALGLATRIGDEGICITLSDTGHGIPDEVLGRMFEPFFTTKEPGKGTGLGLAMVRDLIEQSGGRITVESVPRKGTVFSLLLPAAAQDPLSGPRPRIAPPGATVLLAEDDAAMRAMLVRLLTGAGYAVTATVDGQEALDYLTGGGPCHLLLTDLAMPVLDGPHLIEAVRRTRPELPVLAITVHDQLVPEGIAAILKPFAVDALLGRVRDLVQVTPG